MIVLGLDQSMQLGWACGSASDKRPAWGTYDVPNYGDNDGLTLWDVYNWTLEMITRLKVGHVFFEGVFFPPASMVNQMIIFRMVSIANAIQMAGAKADIPCECVPIQTWRKHFCGRGNATKVDAVAAAAERNWYTSNHHEAEALGIWDWGMASLDPAYASRIGPLLRRREALAEARPPR
jgi:hypothetical protein